MKVAMELMRRFALPWYAQWAIIAFLAAIGVLDLSSFQIGQLPAITG